MIRLLAAHPTAANLLMLIFLVSGLLLIADVRRESLPDITPSEVEVRVPYPGASAFEVEDSIIRSLEDAIDGIPFIYEVRAEARENVGVVVVEMAEGGDFQTFKDDVTTEVAAIDNFPAGAEDPIIIQLGTKDPVLSILVGGDMDPVNLKAYADFLKWKLQQLPGVSLVDVEGFSDRQFRVELSAAALLQYGLSTDDIVNAISRQNITAPVGSISTVDQEILLRLAEQRTSVGTLANLVVGGTPDGAEIRLSDVGSVADTFELDEEKVIIGGRRVAKVKVSKTKTEDSLKIAETVRAFVEEERQRQPNISFRVAEDDSRGLKDRLSLVITNGWQGMILVFMLMWLFFSRRTALWVVMGLPVSFLGAAAFMPALGLTINLMTLVGFLLAVGILMDDAIVIAENIMTHRKRGKGPVQAAVDGVLEVRNGVISSFLTTLCILGPLSFITGDIGKMLKVVPMILLLVLAVSLVEAFLILPAHLAHSLNHAGGEDRESRLRLWFHEKFEHVREHYMGRSVDKVIENRYLFLGIVLGLLIFSAGTLVSGLLPFQALPKLEGNVIVARVLLPQGTPLHKTEAVIDQLQRGLDRMNDIQSARQPGSQSLVRGRYVQYNFNANAYESGPHVATLTVDLLTAEEREGTIEDYVQDWQRETGPLPDVISVTMSEPSVNPAGGDIEIRLMGHDPAALKRAAMEMQGWLGKFRGVYNLSDDLRLGKTELELTLTEGAKALGLDARAQLRQLGAAFQGITADEMQIGQDDVTVDVRLKPSQQDSYEDLANFHLIHNGESVPLSAVTRMRETQGWARLAHVNGLRTVTIRGDVDSDEANSDRLIAELRRDFLPRLEQDHPEIRVAFEGQEKNAGMTRRSIIKGTLTGLIGVFIILSFQFRNYSEPFIVMAIIPFALIGVVFGHLLLGMPFTLPSLLGFISLAGIVVNDSILLVLFIKRALQEGDDIRRAAARASRARFRAIFLTSASTIFGLLPLLLESSLQAQIIQPLAISIAFGMLATTVLVLYVIPCLYVMMDDIGRVRRVRSTDEVTEAKLT